MKAMIQIIAFIVFHHTPGSPLSRIYPVNRKIKIIFHDRDAGSSARLFGGGLDGGASGHPVRAPVG